MSQVIEQLEKSQDPLEQDLAAALRNWQDQKSRAGLFRSLGYEPREIDKHGAAKVIEMRVMSGSSGFEEVDATHSYEAIVARYPDRFSSEAVDKARERLGLINRFADLLRQFLGYYGAKRTGAFQIDDELASAMDDLKSWLENSPAVASRSTIKVKISVGQGAWTKTPWIALLDSRETDTTQSGTYIVFLIAQDLSVIYLTLNQGMTRLRNLLGQKGATEEMVRVAKQTRPVISQLAQAGFVLDNAIDLYAETSAAKNYEIGTIAHLALRTDSLANDDAIHAYLGALLEAYDRVIDHKQSGGLVTDPVAENPAEAYDTQAALRDLFMDAEQFTRLIEIWRSKKNMILQGAPGVGKSFLARRLAYALIGEKNDACVQAVQLHQSYSYEDFVQGYRPNGAHGFERKNGTFFEFRDRALQDPDKIHVFIIDEINRGNLSKIFGELMLLIEPDKRGPTWQTRLAYATDHDPDFFVPENLYLLGMMNTADRSLSLVDYALRRRFAFASMDPMFEAPKFRSHLRNHGVPDELIGKIIGRMGELNEAIEADRINLGPGFRIGHSFFTPTAKVVQPDNWYQRVIETEIFPLLEEYWFDAPETALQWREDLLR